MMMNNKAGETVVHFGFNALAAFAVIVLLDETGIREVEDWTTAGIVALSAGGAIEFLTY